MASTIACTVLALGMVLAAVTSAWADESAVPRVRGVDGRAAALIDEALWRSATFQRMVDEVSASDLIVYVSRTELQGTLRGALRFVGAGADGGRYLLIELDDDVGNDLDGAGDRTAGIATLAHELQHALEVADAEDVQDPGSFDAFYTEVGVWHRHDVVDTPAARTVGAQVYFEMTGRKL